MPMHPPLAAVALREHVSRTGCRADRTGLRHSCNS